MVWDKKTKYRGHEISESAQAVAGKYLPGCVDAFLCLHFHATYQSPVLDHEMNLPCAETELWFHDSIII